MQKCLLYLHSLCLCRSIDQREQQHETVEDDMLAMQRQPRTNSHLDNNNNNMDNNNYDYNSYYYNSFNNYNNYYYNFYYY